MPDFPNPFVSNVPDRKMNFEELTRAIRIDIAGELEAIHLYQAHAQATDNELVKEVLLDIANEERVHVGELQRLLTILLADEAELLAQGKAEVDAVAAKLGVQGASSTSAAAGEAPTIGSLKP
ncbi:MAG: demethoxyubiquinone hydroxylase family protein [Chloroflexi bacterium]|nr:demethoxyubiquinone hydroxylase family protein [Chloroflexota bacterium]